MSNSNPYQAPADPASFEPKTPVQAIVASRDIGGWLVLLAIGTVIAPFRLAFELWSTYRSMYLDGSWSVLTTPGYDAYHPLWQPVLIGEIALNVLLLLLRLYLIYLFFSKKKSLRVWYASTVFFAFVFVMLDTLVVGWIQPDLPSLDSKTMIDMTRTSVFGVIWASYLVYSERARETFTR